MTPPWHDGGMSTAVTESIVITAAPEAVYDLVADVSRMGEWSPEAAGARRASPSPQVGDTFIGLNKRGPIRWATQCTVTAAQRGGVFEFDVNVGPIPVSCWRYDFEPVGDGTTRVTETWMDRRGGPLGLPVRALGQLVIPGDRAAHNRRNMIQTLRRLKETAESA